MRKSFSVTVLEEVSSQDSFAIIVFCQITSRVGSDVESAMTNQQGNVNPCFCCVIVVTLRMSSLNTCVIALTFLIIYRKILYVQLYDSGYFIIAKVFCHFLIYKYTGFLTFNRISANNSFTV